DGAGGRGIGVGQPAYGPPARDPSGYPPRVAAVASEVDPAPIVAWFHEQRMWRSVSPEERAFLADPSVTAAQHNKFGWRQEAEWTLPWMIGKIESLGLPTCCGDARRLCQE